MLASTTRDGLRQARKRAGLSLRELGRQVGVSPSLLSQIETGKTNPSVSTLYALVNALGLSLDALDNSAQVPASRQRAGLPVMPDSAASSEAQVNRMVANLNSATTPDPYPSPARGEADDRAQPVVAASEHTILFMEAGVRWERLTRDHDPDVDALYVTYPPGSSSSVRGELMRHSGVEYAYLISGSLVVQVGFDSHVLQAGDSLRFDSTTPHLYRNVGEVDACGVWFVNNTRPRSDSADHA